MLIIFNLNWKACDIDSRVTRASRSLNTLVEAAGIAPYVQFDLTSIGAGEHVFWKSTPPVLRAKLAENLDFLRHTHAEYRKDLNQDSAFRQYRDIAEMLTRLRGGRHTLAAVFPGKTALCEEALRQARLRDFFENRVYGLDLIDWKKPSLADLYAQAVARNMVSPKDVEFRANHDNDAVAIDDTVEGTRAGKINDIPVAAYISLANCPDSQVRERSVEMVEAGAAYVVTTPKDIENLPNRISTRQKMYETLLPGISPNRPGLNL